MFTIGSLLLLAFLSYFGTRGNDRDRKDYERTPENSWLPIIHIRQDIRLVAVLLAGVIIMLGVLADKLP